MKELHVRLPKPVESISIKEQRTRLRRRGMRKIGEGAFAEVFSRPHSHRVIKFGVSWVTWDSYLLKYVKKVGLNNTNPYFPRIYDVQIYTHTSNAFKTDTAYYYLVEMEKLIPWKKVPARTRDRLMKKLGCKDIYDLERPKKLKTSSKQAHKAVDILRQLFRHNNNTSTDIHTENIMFRRVGSRYQLVYTDPIC